MQKVSFDVGESVDVRATSIHFFIRESAYVQKPATMDYVANDTRQAYRGGESGERALTFLESSMRTALSHDLQRRRRREV